MSIAAMGLDSQQASALDADLAQLAHDMNRLHHLARSGDAAAMREHFARLEHTVNCRLNQLAYVLAARDGNSIALSH